jgi:hypothetical protein
MSAQSHRVERFSPLPYLARGSTKHAADVVNEIGPI